METRTFEFMQHVLKRDERPVADRRDGSPRVDIVASARRSFRGGAIFLPIIAIALWIFTHPYRGVVGDASLYIGRAIADMDPQGLGRDILFANDGQSRFTIYTWMVKGLVFAIGTDGAALALGFAGTLLWLAALMAVARRFVGWPLVWIIVVFVAVLPVHYGDPQRFQFSEMFTVPRPMSEALVLFALAAFLSRNWLCTIVFLALATAVHPLMALAGWAALGLAIAFEDKRWWFAAVFAAVALGVGAYLGIPLLHRLFEPMDAELKAFAMSRSPLLFPTLWPASFLGGLATQMVTIAIAASLYNDRRRLILVAMALVGIIGISVQAVFADLLSSLLVIQVQCWRMAWLTAAAGSFALAICTLELWPRGGIHRIVLALLAMAWLAGADVVAAPLLAAAALLLHFATNGSQWHVPTVAVRLVWLVAWLLALLLNAAYLAAYWNLLAGVPQEASVRLGSFWTERFSAFPLCALLLFLMLPRGPSRLLTGCRCAAACLLVFGAASFWDDRTPMQKMVDRRAYVPELMETVAQRPGEVLWVGGFQEAWFLTGRPQWASPQQGVATVFSRDLTVTWRERITFLRDEGLADGNVLSQLSIPAAKDTARVSEAGLAHLCARRDAPAWVIAPIEVGTNPAPNWPARIWHLSRPLFGVTDEGDAYLWHRVDEVAILPCSQKGP